MEFEYTEAAIDETVRDVDTESLKNLPYGIDGSKYRWVDLDGEGLSGILTEQGGSWFYKPNLSPANQQIVTASKSRCRGSGPCSWSRASLRWRALSSGRQQLMDLSGDGQLDLVDFERPDAGILRADRRRGLGALSGVSNRCRCWTGAIRT